MYMYHSSIKKPVERTNHEQFQIYLVIGSSLLLPNQHDKILSYVHLVTYRQ